mgnify:CR=1 FL=1
MEFQCANVIEAVNFEDVAGAQIIDLRCSVAIKQIETMVGNCFKVV